jgi:hypothetical protein
MFSAYHQNEQLLCLTTKKGHLPLVFLPKEKCPFIHLIFEKCSSKIINILLVNK